MGASQIFERPSQITCMRGASTLSTWHLVTKSANLTDTWVMIIMRVRGRMGRKVRGREREVSG